MRQRKISATLGPTNTGKTYSAIKKLLQYSNGVIGFPLRLLARENFEATKKEIGEEKVALVTGEEKVIPEKAKYFFCTVESIPDQKFDFVAIDEVQLCADYERGHLFSEKVFSRKGEKETMFLGSMSMENILKKIYPKITIHKKPRLSKLSYCGYKNLSRLPKRSAVIAFSLIDVYEIANKIKQAHGGVSVVMGALSPDVRNAQVKLFEDGGVDHIVATDAIGLGLNLNIKNIFFSGLIKFDGIRERKLTNDEISQIAGRAGRYIHDGFFGTTGNLKFLDNELINFVENYDYSIIEKIFWRNTSLNFSSIKILLDSLSKRADKKYLVAKKNASDHRYLKILGNDKSIKKDVNNSKDLKKLWELCRTPDYSRELDEFHSRFLKKIFRFLIADKKLIPAPWIENELNKIEKKTKKISELNYKISQIRKWSFLAFKNNWMEKNEVFRKKIKSIELELSLVLHSQLINEFVGEFKNQNIFFNKNKNEKFQVEIDNFNSIIFGKRKIGTLNGFKFNISNSFKANSNIFNNKILKNYLVDIAKNEFNSFTETKFNEFEFNIKGEIIWKKSIIAKLIKGSTILKPKIKLLYDEFFFDFKEKIELKLAGFLNYVLAKDLSFLNKVNSLKISSPQMRAIIYSLVENLGQCRRDKLKIFYSVLNSNELDQLKRNGFKCGFFFLYFKEKNSNYFRQILINVHFGGQLSSHLDGYIYQIKKNSVGKGKIEFYRKMGFYTIKVLSKYYLVYFEYLESIIKKRLYYQKKKLHIKKFSNKFEKDFFEKKHKITFLKDDII